MKTRIIYVRIIFKGVFRKHFLSGQPRKIPSNFKNQKYFEQDNCINNLFITQIRLMSAHTVDAAVDDLPHYE